MESRVPSTAVCPCCLLRSRRSGFVRVLNINLIHKPHSGCLESQSFLFKKGARWEEDRGQWNILVQANSFGSQIALFSVPLQLAQFDLLAIGLQIIKIFYLQNIMVDMVFHPPAFRRH